MQNPDRSEEEKEEEGEERERKSKNQGWVKRKVVLGEKESCWVNERNGDKRREMETEEEDIREQLLELIQVKTHFWVRNKVVGCAFSLVQWQSNPMECARELKRYRKSLKMFNQQ
ncbi:hypothetical protein SLEP1_g43551 [Rubroshorea leprosula]|uniref:Uncharacterized protein n=1 Tax=Rubroshorea leprosula TaxID=152421 RepID=A0AAV5LDG3_9ROSI|nr:hypothetical protein SLEP1_g43551 [Rubroshorea leprosula]